MTTPLIRLLNDASTSAQLPHETLRTLCGEAAAEIARLHTLIPAKQLPPPTPVVPTYTPQAIQAMLDAANPHQRARAWLNPHGEFTAEQIETGLTDVSAIVRLAVWERFDLAFTAAQIDRGLDDDTLSVRKAAEYAFAHGRSATPPTHKRKATSSKSSVLA